MYKIVKFGLLWIDAGVCYLTSHEIVKCSN